MDNEEPKRSKFADTRFTGPEPQKNIIIEDDNDPRYHHAHYWYNYYFDVDNTKDWLVEYLQSVPYDVKVVKHVKSLPSWKIPVTAGRIAKLLTRGWSLPDKSMQFLKDSISDLDKYKEVKEESPKATVKAPDRTAAKLSDILAKFDGHIDSFSMDQEYKFSLYNFLTIEKASAAAINSILSLSTEMIEEINLKEGYEYLTKDQHKKFIQFFKGCVSDCNRFSTNSKTVKKSERKPRKIKEKTADKLTSNVKYLKEAPELKLVSISPQEIIKAQSIWVYDNKYRKLAVYNAMGPEGLSIKGTTIINFDEKASIQKRLRKPEETLSQVIGCGKVALRKIMEQVKTTHTVPTGRLNADILILRAVK